MKVSLTQPQFNPFFLGFYFTDAVGKILVKLQGKWQEGQITRTITKKQKQLLEMFFKIGVLKNFAIFIAK